MEQGAKAAAKETGVYLEYAGPRQANIDEHIHILEKAAASKVDGIMTQGLTEKEFTPVINHIVEKNIPVVTIDTDAPTSKRTAYIGTDNYYAGFIAGRALEEDMHGKANVAIITGSFTASNQQLRVQGFKDAVKEEKGIHIVAVEESHITRVQAAEKAYNILKNIRKSMHFTGQARLTPLASPRSSSSFTAKKEHILSALIHCRRRSATCKRERFMRPWCRSRTKWDTAR